MISSCGAISFSGVISSCGATSFSGVIDSFWGNSVLTSLDPH